MKREKKKTSRFSDLGNTFKCTPWSVERGQSEFTAEFTEDQRRGNNFLWLLRTKSNILRNPLPFRETSSVGSPYTILQAHSMFFIIYPNDQKGRLGLILFFQ